MMRKVRINADKFTLCSVFGGISLQNRYPEFTSHPNVMGVMEDINNNTEFTNILFTKELLDHLIELLKDFEKIDFIYKYDSYIKGIYNRLSNQYFNLIFDFGDITVESTFRFYNEFDNVARFDLYMCFKDKDGTELFLINDDSVLKEVYDNQFHYNIKFNEKIYNQSDTLYKFYNKEVVKILTICLYYFVWKEIFQEVVVKTAIPTIYSRNCNKKRKIRNVNEKITIFEEDIDEKHEEFIRGHIRKAHVRSQRYGKNNAFIKPVFIVTTRVRSYKRRI